MPKSAAASNVNLYDAIGLDPQDSLSTIKEKLHDLKAGWMSKAARSGSQGETARSQIDLIAEAEKAFEDEDSREIYDLSLRRNPVEKVANSQVDWLTRAWNYYFVGDSGAADVAARFAREQDPKNALAFVVSAWVKLLEGKDGQRQAKDFSDEAFVLDELGQETSDVHHVRGVVYYLLGDYDRAGKSFDRALAAATDGEKPEILLRKSRVCQAIADWPGVADACTSALSLPFPLSRATEAGLIDGLTNAIVTLDQVSDIDQTIRNYKERRTAVEASAIQPDPKAVILGNLDVLDQMAETSKRVNAQIADQEGKARAARKTKSATGSRPDFPIWGLLIGILNVFLLPVWAQAGGWVIVPLLFIGVFGGYAVYGIAKRNTWDTENAEFQRQSAHATTLEEEAARLRSSLPGELADLKRKLSSGVAQAVAVKAA